MHVLDVIQEAKAGACAHLVKCGLTTNVDRKKSMMN